MLPVKRPLLNTNYLVPVNHWTESNAETFTAARPETTLIPVLVYAHRLSEEDKKSFMVIEHLGSQLNVEYHYQENQQWLKIDTTMQLHGTDQNDIIRNLMDNFLRFTETPREPITSSFFVVSIVPTPMMLLPMIRLKFIELAQQLGINDIIAASNIQSAANLR